MGMEKAKVARRVPADVALVVFGTDAAKKRHASRFGSASASIALEAARSMGMRTLRVVSDEQRHVALKLPAGKVSPKGRAVIPLVRPTLYDKLLAVAGEPAPSNDKPVVPAAKADPKPPSGSTPNGKPDGGDDRSRIVRGTIVLAKEKIGEVYWLEAIIEHVDGDTFTLLWHHWPDEPKFKRHITQVALLHPKMVTPC